MSERSCFPVVLSGTSGAGKTTICERLLAGPHGKSFLFSVSMTTRPARAGERDGFDYRFAEPSFFEALVERGEMLEYATVHGELYGTPRRNWDEARASRRHLLLDIDVEGARQMREAVAETVSIFIVPPTAKQIVDRLRGRGSETRRELRRRLSGARSELESVGEFDYLVVNDSLEDATEAVLSVILGSAAATGRISAGAAARTASGPEPGDRGGSPEKGVSDREGPATCGIHALEADGPAYAGRIIRELEELKSTW